jgi:hypothetical protein
MPSQREQYGSTVHLFIDAGRSPRKITSMSITFVNGLWKSIEDPEVFSSLSRFPLVPSRRSFPAYSFGCPRPSSGSAFVLVVLPIHNSESENTCSYNSLGKHCQIMFLRTFGGRRPPTASEVAGIARSTRAGGCPRRRRVYRPNYGELAQSEGTVSITGLRNDCVHKESRDGGVAYPVHVLRRG